MSRPRRTRPRYPALVAAAALAALATACGPEWEGQQQSQPLQGPVDAGVDAGSPLPPDFLGGGAPYESFDGGTLQ